MGGHREALLLRARCPAGGVLARLGRVLIVRISARRPSCPPFRSFTAPALLPLAGVHVGEGGPELVEPAPALLVGQGEHGLECVPEGARGRRSVGEPGPDGLQPTSGLEAVLVPWFEGGYLHAHQAGAIAAATPVASW